MKGKPIHQNLSTSFVDLSALVRHLSGLQFSGSVRIEFASYEAEIIFTGTSQLQAREYDKLVGRISQGERAFKRILARAREPQGRVHVIQAATAESAAYVRKPFIDERIISEARLAAFGNGDRLVRVGTSMLRPLVATVEIEYGGAVELASELLLTVKEAFSRSRLDFERAFAKACEAEAKKHSFLAPSKGLFTFRGGEIRLSERVGTDELFAGIVEALRNLFNRMRGQTKFSKLLAFSRHRLQQHLSSRHDQYARLGLIETIDRLFT